MKLKHIHQEIPVQVTREKLWKVLLHYGDVADFHAGVARSYRAEGSNNEASMGCERVCKIVDLGLKITLKERIIEFVEGSSYKYEVYEWKNFPIQKMYFEFKILKSSATHTVLGLNIEYKAKPAFLTPLLMGKMKRLALEVLLDYKHYAETREARVPIKKLKSTYQANLPSELQYE